MDSSATSILGYGCVTAAGSSVDDLWLGLKQGHDHSSRAEGFPSACFFPTRRSLLEAALESWQQAKAVFDPSKSVGVILASAKGEIEDLVWDENKFREFEGDPYSRLLDEFARGAGLEPRRRIAVSNACASSLSALFLARHWLAASIVDQVVVVAADRVGRFVSLGFEALRALTPDRVRPFSADRSGLRLGEAAAVVVLGRGFDRVGAGFVLEGVAIDSDGASTTKPAAESLKRACRRLPNAMPDLIVAHGTATRINDPIEDEAFAALYGANPAVTATKWCVGHSLGASGAIDLIAACEALRRQDAFAIAATVAPDPAFGARYLVAGTEWRGPLDRVLVSSLGFGGIHAAALVSRRGAA